MPLESLLSRARYLAIALPLFALGSTLHAGCNLAPNGNYYGNYRSSAAPSTADSSKCIEYRARYDAHGEALTEGELGPCDEDDGYSGYGPSGGSVGHGYH